MPRIRSIKPGFFRSEDVSALPFRARLTWVGLWTHCDDQGRAKDNSRLIKGDVWPLDNVSLRDIDEDLETLADHGRIVRYEVDGKRYLEIVNWHAHQSISKPSPSRIPAPSEGRILTFEDEPEPPADVDEEHTDDHEPSNSESPPGTLPEPSRKAPGGKGRERRGGEGRGGEARASASEPPPASTMPTFMPPTQEHLINTETAGTFAATGHHGLQEGSAGMAPPGQLDPDEPPPIRCPDHIRTLGEVPPCRACGAAKAEHQQWQARRISAEAEARSRTAKERAENTRAEIAACDQCDSEGRLSGGRLCHHNPGNAERTNRGAAAARAALAGKAD